MIAVAGQESTWLEDIKGQIAKRLDEDDFVAVGNLAALVSKVQTAINGHKTNTPWKCTTCTKTFKRRSALREHIKYKHQEGRCKTCGKIFKSKGGLAAHLRSDRDPHKGL